MNDEELDEIRQRCEAATRGPWVAYIEGRNHQGGSDFIMRGAGAERAEDLEMTGATEADFDFIAGARQDVPRLLAEVARLRANLSRE